MKKIEIIWRELLYQSLEKGNKRFSQKEVSAKFGFSTSTVFQALKPLRKMGAARVGGRGFVLEDPEKLVYHWASVRDLEKDIIFKGSLDLPVFEIEGSMPAGTVYGGFSAARYILGEAPSDYDKVYVYRQDPEEIKKRFVFGKGRQNLFILKADEFLPGYGGVTPLGQTFVDLWNMPEWYAKDFIKALKEKIDGLLS